MTYDQLIVLDTIIKTGSFKAASEYLNKTQPSVSISIKKLEQEFEIKLFSRDEYRPRLTEQGKAFYNKTLRALDTFKELEVYAKELSKGVESEINIYVDAVFPIKILTPFIEQFDCQINLYVDLLDGLMEKVVTKQADFAIGTYIKQSDSIEARKISSIKMVPVISSKKYNEYARSYKSIKNYNQVIVRSSAQNFKENIVGHEKLMKKCFTSDMATKKELILNGVGWGRLPEHIVREYIKNKTLKVINEIEEINEHYAPLYLMRNRDHVQGPLTKKLWNQILD